MPEADGTTTQEMIRCNAARTLVNDESERIEPFPGVMQQLSSPDESLDREEQLAMPGRCQCSSDKHRTAPRHQSSCAI